MVLAASCEKEIEKESPADATTGKMITETISAQIEGETKATVDADAKFAWTGGDNIAVHVSNGTYVTSGGASAAAASASFTVSYPGGYSRDAFAIFPSTIVAADAAHYGQSGTALDVTLPASYTLAQVSDTATPCPMIAANVAGTGWTFSQLCGLLRLTVNSIPDDATGIVIQFPGNKVNGAFSIASPVKPGTSTIATGTPASGEDQITVTFAKGTTSVTINLPLPTGDYDDVFITPVDSETEVAAVRHISAGGYTAQAAHGKKLTTTMVSFSVSSTKKVVFAPANLVATIGADYASTEWFFHANQYDMVYTHPSGKDYPYQSFAEGANIDLFGFVGVGATCPSGLAEWGINESVTNSNYGGGEGENDPLWHDWGENVIGGYTANFWYTPSIEEWEYVFATRTAPSGRFCKGKLSVVEDGIIGVILFPDNFVRPGDIDTPEGLNAGTSAAINNYTASQWEEMEAAGAIFFPSAGHRQGNKISDAHVENDVTLRIRTSSHITGDKANAYRVLFNNTNMNFNSTTVKRSTGMTVRLVREL